MSAGLYSAHGPVQGQDGGPAWVVVRQLEGCTRLLAVAEARDRLITPTPQQIASAERELERVRDALPAELWARLVRCKARAMASVAIAQRRMGLVPTGRKPPLPKAQRPFDARRAAANDLDEDDDDQAQ